MYALYLTGPLVEQIYGPIRMVLFYLVAALGGSIASFAFGDAAVRRRGVRRDLRDLRRPLRRVPAPPADAGSAGPALLRQVGSLIVINILIGFSLGFVDNVAHLGGLAAGLLMGVAFPPGGVIDAGDVADAVHRIAAGDGRGGRRPARVGLRGGACRSGISEWG